jgi:hypothetical protein
MPKQEVNDARLPEWLVVGFCGHRRLTDPSVVEGAVRRVVGGLQDDGRRIIGICSAALGADLIFAEEMRHRGFPLQVVLPFPVDRFEHDFATQRGEWPRARAIIDAAIDLDIAAAAPDADAAYLDTGVRIVERADVLIAAWDGQPARGVGGTGDVVAYARAVGRPLVIIDPVSGTVLRDPAAEGGAGTTAGGAGAVTSVQEPREQVRAFFEAADAEAARQGPAVRELTRWLVWLQLLAATVTSAALVFGAEGPWALGSATVDVGVLAGAFALLFVRGRRYSAWWRRRAEAELSRSTYATWDIRRQAPPGHARPGPLPGLARFSRALDLLRQLDRSPLKGLQEAREAYVRDRVDTQIAYFTAKHRLAHAQVTRRKILIAGFTAAGVLSSVILAALLFAPPVSTRTTEWVEFLGLVGPLGASAIGVLLISDESSRRNQRYAEALTSLRAFLPRLRAAPTWDALYRVVSEVEEHLLLELIEWRAFVRHVEEIH